ncbi:hypothetical protein KSS87_000802 [Heliosperma pusillum]|nr:hypothetical protein KSS87_000802 [Heliosperma pusillum]
MDQQHKGQLSNLLLEHTWFFGNTLHNKSKSKSSKFMVRSNSDPCPSSTTTKDNTLSSPDYHSIKMNNNLCRAPSLPTSLGKGKKYELVEEEEEEDEPRMGDLIRQAMPMPNSTRRLDRMMSLPPCRVANEASSIIIATDVEKGGNLCRKVSVESPALLQEKGPIAVTKLSRGASVDLSLLLPPKCNPKGTKQNPSNSMNKTPRKKEPTKMKNPTKIDHSNIHTLDNKIKSQKSLSALEIEELQGFKDLGFSTDNMDLTSNVTQIRPGRLQRHASLDSKVMKPYFSDAPTVPDWVDPKATSSQDMKAQIKFWARAVASNVRQEC